MKIAVLGRSGFIGSALTKKLANEYYKPFNYLRNDLDIVYWFSAPSSQILFNYAPKYCFKETIESFINIADFCKENDIKFHYPSSATVYNLNNDYSRCKSKLESLALNYPRTVGFRIFAGYGPGEAHKGEYASIIYQFCKVMKEGKRPIIFGDGTQTRDFIYIDDIVDNILENADKTFGTVDIGTGVNTSFNDIVQIINQVLGTKLDPVYIDKPIDYINDTPCNNPCKIKTSLREGIMAICESL